MSDPADPKDPIDDAYIDAETRLADAHVRAARRAAVLAAVAAEPVAQPARPALKRYGGWSAAAVLAIGVLIASRVYKPEPPAAPDAHEPKVASTVKAPSVSAPTGGVLSQPEPKQVPTPPTTAAGRPPSVEAPMADAAPSPRLAAPPVEQLAPPPPLPLPPVEKPLQAAPAPPPPPPPALPRAFSEADRQPSARMASAMAVAPAARLRAASEAGRADEVAGLLAQGAPVDAQDADGDTALIKAVRSGQVAVAAELRRHGASLDLANKAGLTARAIAATKADPDLDKALGIER